MELLLLLMAVGAVLPIAIAYGRGLDDWTMIWFWLWLMVPVLGWLVVMSIALDGSAKKNTARPISSTAPESQKVGAGGTAD